MLSLTPCSGLEHLAIPGRHGAPAGEPGVRLTLRTGLALASMVARKGRAHVLADRVRDVLGVDLPRTPHRVAEGPISIAWAGPGQWLVAMENAVGQALEPRLRHELEGTASIADQSDGRTVIRVGGSKVRDALAKGVPIDLHPRAFGPGETAVTIVAHIGVHFWQLDAAPTYEFVVFRSYAVAFWGWLLESSLEFGAEVAGS